MNTIFEVNLNPGDQEQKLFFQELPKAYQYCQDWHKTWNPALGLFLAPMRPLSAVVKMLDAGDTYYLSSVNSEDKDCYIKIIERELL